MKGELESMPPEVTAHLDAAIGILANANTLQTASLVPKGSPFVVNLVVNFVVNLVDKVDDKVDDQGSQASPAAARRTVGSPEPRDPEPFPPE